ncbi:hypothetical protein NPIL_521451 [Nephila pilipes]|uniref:Uncharacterized protein n=1 Tax=Nephila pilipes TaxID=299642 RepID=A0A8X6PEY2_NEPPI|nr:hypothetical protein NPIL_521451 [Nephila pilipes]
MCSSKFRKELTEFCLESLERRHLILAGLIRSDCCSHSEKDSNIMVLDNRLSQPQTSAAGDPYLRNPYSQRKLQTFTHGPTGGKISSKNI